MLHINTITRAHQGEFIAHMLHKTLDYLNITYYILLSLGASGCVHACVCLVARLPGRDCFLYHFLFCPFSSNWSVLFWFIVLRDMRAEWVKVFHKCVHYDFYLKLLTTEQSQQNHRLIETSAHRKYKLAWTTIGNVRGHNLSCFFQG